MAGDELVGRRSFLKVCGIVGVALAAEGVSAVSRRLPALLPPRLGPDDPPIPNDAVQRIYTERFQGRTIQRGHVTLDMASMSEDGRYVPVAIASDLPMADDQYVKSVFLIVDHNPDPLVTAFHLTPALGPVQIQTRIKMRRTSWIRAIAETSTGELWADYRSVETTLNGCG
ncbi:MAG TPA: thiosulfate oxidation carrier protein SoxY [Gemmatimonadales bacterium]|nr:thiosulfate oxidation carrier protein SoxY [Gemmatimonadales bacterium]